MRFCSQSKLYYIGFSQGTAQAFAAFSSNPDLLAKVNLFVALSPAVRANHLSKSLLLSLVQANLRCVNGGPAWCCVAGERYCVSSKCWSVIGLFPFGRRDHIDFSWNITLVALRLFWL